MKIDQREDYQPKENFLSSKKPPKDPLKLFKKWYSEAEKFDATSANNMVLSTVNRLNRPRQRIVLLREISEGNLIFYTNYQSKKGQALEGNPYVSALFYWGEFHRQVLLSGIAKKVSREKSIAYFQTRPLENRVGAIFSKQSKPLENYEIFSAKVAEEIKKAEKDESNYSCPANWGGYAITPMEWEFWQGQPSRLHHRISYRLSKKNWKVQRLYP